LAGDFAAGARGGSHASDASGRKLPALAGPEHEGRRSCYGLFRNFMVLLHGPAARRLGRAAGPGLAVVAGDAVGDLSGDRRGGQPGHQRPPQERAVVVEGALVLVPLGAAVSAPTPPRPATSSPVAASRTPASGCWWA
jgi:hypothetical protein